MARKKIALLCLAACLAVVAAGLLLRTAAGRKLESSLAIRPEVAARPAAAAAGLAATIAIAATTAPKTNATLPITSATPPIAADASTTSLDVVVGRNDTLDAIFHRLALDKADLAAIRSLPGIRPHLDFMKPGDTIRLTHSGGGAILELSRKVSETQTLQVARRDSGFAAQMLTEPVETRVRTAAAVIDESLFQAAEAADMSDNVALKLANVFAWDIDFVLDIRAGDRFTAVYEQIFQNGKYLRDGEVLAAEFVNDGKLYRAIRFVADGGAAGYYTPEGKPMRKAFLRAPVEFTRVSSVFAINRRHPILNLIRGHMGTDYAAPIGTPIHAAGDGRVSFQGTRGGYGNAVVLLHSSNVSTLYGHMSRFAKNIHLGTRVNQGDVIGYVGMTGLATGPHLHYEFLMNGVHMNPQTVRLPGAEPLHAESLAKFRLAAASLLAGLSAAVTNAAAAGEPAAVATAGSLADSAGGNSRSKTSVN